jgi:hypothetical protein
MERFTEQENIYERIKFTEIYLSDATKVLPDTLNTVLRICVEKKYDLSALTINNGDTDCILSELMIEWI